MSKYLRPCLLLCLLLCGRVQVARGGEDILQIARRDGSQEDFKRQLDVTPPADINGLVDSDGKTALFHEAAQSHQERVALLLLAGADVNLRDKAGRTAAFDVVTHQGEDYQMILEMMALKHTDLSARDNDNMTLLATAAQAGNLTAARFLIYNGVNPAPIDVPGNKTPLFFALSQQDQKMADLLQGQTKAASPVDGGPADAVEQGLDTDFLAAVHAGHLRSLARLMAAGADVNQREAGGATALYAAVSERRAGVVALLLLKGANPNLGLPSGRTPLMESMLTCNLASERMMLELTVAGADINASSKDHSTAMTVAVHSRNDFGAKWMIWRGANLDVHGPEGTLMQSAAANADFPSMIELLRKAGLTPEKSLDAKRPETALIDAVRAGDMPAVEAELRKGVPVDAPNRYDQTALEWAVCYAHWDMVDLFLRRGANVNHQHSYNGEHIIHTIASWDNSMSASAADSITELIKRGANPNLVMKDGNTPLMISARQGVTGPSMELLLRVTTDINARNKAGQTALDLARLKGHVAAAKMLQDHGALE